MTDQLKNKLDYSGCFKPTHTTSILLSVAKQKIDARKDVLDLGCGSGIVGIDLKLKNPKINLFMSDLSETAVITACKNTLSCGVDAVVKCSNLFEKWDGFKFDLIVNDVSGVSEKIADETPWFDNVPCNAGSCGLLLTEKIINAAPQYLREKGVLLFPFISLSSKNKLNKILSDRKHELISCEEWPLPSELLKKEEKIRELAKEGYIDIREKFGMLIAYTEVYAINI